MGKYLIVYGTREGQAAKIAHHLAGVFWDQGHSVMLCDARYAPANLSFKDFAGVIVGSSIRFGKHQKPVVDFVKARRLELEETQAVFFSVSISAAANNEKTRALADEYYVKFVKDTGWKPERKALFKGALAYSKYNLFLRILLKYLNRNSLGLTSIRWDYEYTDWAEVTAFAESFLPAPVLV